MAVKVQEKNETLEIGSSEPLFQMNPPASQWAWRTFDVTADGKRFIVVTRLPRQRAQSQSRWWSTGRRC